MHKRHSSRFAALHLSLLLLCLQMPLLAQESHDHHDHAAVSGLGTVHFPISCGEAAQTRFNRALALLHSFGYRESAQQFSEIAVQSPNCGMAYWGIAMSYYHPIWAPPTRLDLEQGAAAAAKASLTSAVTTREKDYISAIVLFYRDWQTVPHRKRADAYLESMKALHERYPDDDEAAIFYALEVRGLADDNDKTLTQQKKAAEILLAVLPRNPNHPGVAHYLIHSFDYPSLAEKALPAARAYAKIAPDAPHALHMPTHIFTRLGLWDESVASNLASAAAARRRLGNVAGVASFDELHADDYLVYAWLQQAQDDRALGVIREMQSKTSADEPQFAAAYSLAAAPVRYALEREDWKSAAQLKISPAWFPWSNFPHAVAIVSFGRALGCARTGDLNGALAAIGSLEELERAEPATQAYDWKSQIEIQIIAAKSWVELARGNRSEALKMARQAADKEDATEKHPVTPGAVRPARELLADMLLEASSPAEALTEYRASLKISPRRYRSMAGAAQAAERAGDSVAAAGYARDLLVLANGSTSGRPELKQSSPNFNK